MPLLDDHLRQAERNLDFSLSLDPGKYSDWIATGLFYTALHYVDAFLATKNQHPGKHDIRDGFVAKLHELKPLYSEYRALKDSSRNARYWCIPGYSVTHLGQLRGHVRRIADGLRPYVPIP